MAESHPEGPTHSLVLYPDAPARDRTWDLVIKSDLLYQLSYGGPSVVDWPSGQPRPAAES